MDQDPWNKAMYSMLEPSDHRGPVMDHAEGGTVYQRYHAGSRRGILSFKGTTAERRFANACITGVRAQS